MTDLPEDDDPDDDEYLDDDPDQEWELPPSPFERSQYGDAEAWARQRTRTTYQTGELEPRLPLARFDRRRRGPKTRQVNFRTSEVNYGELARAASIVDLSPTRLAAVLVRDGVARILHEHALAHRRPRPGR